MEEGALLSLTSAEKLAKHIKDNRLKYDPILGDFGDAIEIVLTGAYGGNEELNDTRKLEVINLAMMVFKESLPGIDKIIRSILSPQGNNQSTYLQHIPLSLPEQEELTHLLSLDPEQMNHTQSLRLRELTGKKEIGEVPYELLSILSRKPIGSLGVA